MKRYLLRRLLLVLPVVWGVSTLVFLFLHLIPGDPAEIMLGETARAADKAALRRDLGLDRPLPEQYLRFMGDLLQGDLGESYYFKAPVLDVVFERFPATLELAVAAMGIALLLSLPLGTLAALHAGGPIDHGAMLFAMLGVSMPRFWIGPLLIMLFSIRLDLLPVSGREGFASLVLPAFTLGTALAAMLSRMVRTSLLEVIDADFITAVRAKGAPEYLVIGKHAMKNALVPVITVLGLQFGALLSGAVVTEMIFSWPGIGGLLIQAIETRDYRLVQGCVLVIAFCYVFVNLLTDLCYAAVDPRVRFE